MKRTLLISLAVLAILVIALIIASPNYAKHYINENGKELTGRKLSLEGLSFNPINGHLTLLDFVFYEKDDTTVFVSFDTLFINLTIYKLLSSEIHADEIKLSHPIAHILLHEEQFNFDDLIPEKDTTQIAEKSKNDTKYTLNNILIKRGFIDYEHIEMNAQHVIKELNLEIPGISWGEDKADAGLLFSLEKGGTFQTDFHFDKSTNLFNWNLEVLDLHLSNTLPYVQKFAKVKNIEGDMDGYISVFGSLDSINAANFVTRVSINDLKLIDELDSKFLGFNKLEILSDTLNAERLNFNLDSVTLESPHIIYTLDKDSISNFDKILIADKSEKDTIKKDTTLAQFSYYLNFIRVHNGSVDYTDESLKPKPFNYNLSDIEFSADAIQEGNFVDYYLSALLNNSGTFNADVHFDPNDPGNGEFNLEIKGSEIKDFSPFSESYFAYPLESGRLSFSTQNVVNDRYLNSHIVLDLFGSELGEKNEEHKPAFNVPLKLALVVLRDPKGRIHFDVPAEGDMNSPDFKYRKLVFKVLLNVMVKAAISPYKLLSQAVGADEESIKKIRLDRGQNYMGPEQSSQIDLIARLLNEKEGLEASVTLHVDEEDEKEYIVERMAKEKYYSFIETGSDSIKMEFDNTDKAKINAIEEDDEGLLSYLQTRTQLTEVNAFDSLARSLSKNLDIDLIYDVLIEERLNMIQEYINMKHDSIPITILDEWMDEKKVSKPYFNVEYLVN